ncbi:hypothetical protein ES703_98760 [subsurface metagenome]
MSWEEILALIYIFVVIIVFWFFMVRWFVREVRKLRSNAMSKYEANNGKGNNRYNQPEQDRMGICKVSNRNKCPNEKSATNCDDNIPPFSLHRKGIIKRQSTKCK